MYVSSVGSVWSGIPHGLYLVESLFGRAIEFEFKDIDVVLSLDDAVGTSFALLFLGEHEIGADDAEDEIELAMAVANPRFTSLFGKSRR